MQNILSSRAVTVGLWYYDNKEIKSPKEVIDVELSQLRYFVTLSRLCNYSKAAEELFIAQPTLSQQIKRLEEELGVQLFERSTRKVALTPIGQECLLWAEKALEATDLMVQTAKAKNRRDQGSVSLGVLAIYPMTNISNVLNNFRQDHSEVDLQVTFANSVDLVDMLLRKKLDAVISNVSSDVLERETLDMLLMDVFWEDRLHVVMSTQHPLYLRGKPISLEDILDERLFFNSPRSSVRLRFHQALRAKGYALPDCVECPSISNMFNFIQGNMGITVMSSHIAKAYLLKDMACLPIEPPLQTQTALITRKTSRNPALKQFRDYFHTHLERLPL